MKLEALSGKKQGKGISMPLRLAKREVAGNFGVNT
jgi:hypothetical protein